MNGLAAEIKLSRLGRSRILVSKSGGKLDASNCKKRKGERIE